MNFDKTDFGKTYPEAITIEILDACNLKCKHCYLQFQPKSSRSIMHIDFFEKIINRLSGVLAHLNRINFSSIEALFHPRIFDMIDLIKGKKPSAEIYLNTNGMLLDDKCIANLVTRGIRDLHISLDGCNKKTIESFKTGLDFDRVIANVKNLKKAAGDKINIRANFVLHKNNLNELLEYIDFCKNLGISSINIIGFISYGPDMADYCLYSEAGIQQIDSILAEAKAKAENMGIFLKHHGTKTAPKGCGYAAGLMYIDKNANIVPCSLLAKNTQFFLFGKTRMTEQIIWGNVLKDDPMQVWTSKESVDFRYALQREKLPRECILCAIGHKVIC